MAPALGVLIVSAEAVGVARALAVEHGYRVDPNRDLMAIGGVEPAAGLSSGFVQSGGASQTAAADGAGGRSQLATMIAAGLVLLTGAFLAPLFEDLPQATLAAIVIVAVSGFYDVAELRRLAHVRRSAIVFAGLALAGVLGLGVLQGLVVTAGLTLVYVLLHLSRQRSVSRLERPNAEDGRVGARRRRHRRRARAPPASARSGSCCDPPTGSARSWTSATTTSSTSRRSTRTTSWRTGCSTCSPARGAGADATASSVLDLSLSADLDVQSADMLGTLAREVERAPAPSCGSPRCAARRAGRAHSAPASPSTWWLAGTIDDALR